MISIEHLREIDLADLDDSYHPCKGTVSKMVVELRAAGQLLLPFDQVRQANVHMFARRFGLQVKTKTIMLDGVKKLKIERVA